MLEGEEWIKMKLHMQPKRLWCLPLSFSMTCGHHTLPSLLQSLHEAFPPESFKAATVNCISIVSSRIWSVKQASNWNAIFSKTEFLYYWVQKVRNEARNHGWCCCTPQKHDGLIVELASGRGGKKEVFIQQPTTVPTLPTTNPILVTAEVNTDKIKLT